jgi:hypothetical protein
MSSFACLDILFSMAVEELIMECVCLDMSHTILLLQSTSKLDSRTYSDYESVDECLDGIPPLSLVKSRTRLDQCFSCVGVCKVFEEHLKKRNPTSPSITYDISELFEFVDQIADLSCLVFQKQTGQYKPHNKEWIKQEIFQLLRKQAAGGR